MPSSFIPFKAWWKEAVIYQIYPISFFDSNGDGFGDLNGILKKLDYLKDLGVDVVWLSPIYRSPLADMGYDISDYCDIDPRYGSLEDWDTLLKGVHARGMKLMMDLVINHTSDEHEWFLQSRSSKPNPKRDWYIWRPPKFDAEGNRMPPNNWKSNFQGSAWAFDEGTQEYYLHLYVEKQPDLNWDNPDVREAAWEVMQFWVDRGCDGFRMDVINLLSKVDGLPDAPISDPGEAYQPASLYFANGPRVHEYIKEMNKRVLSKHELITVGETPFTHDSAALAAYVLPANDELQMVFHFEIMDLDSKRVGQDLDSLVHRPWALSDLKRIVGHWQMYERSQGFWNTIFIENHDHSRAVSRFGNDSETWRALSAKMIAIMQVGQGGTQFIYQGQELGLKNFPGTWGIEEYKDVASINYWKKMLEQRKQEGGLDMSDVLENFQKKARDHSRVPMQWDASSNAGFTSGIPWMRVNEDYAQWNAEDQVADAGSVHAFYRKALAVRKQYEVLIYGDYLDISQDNVDVFAFVRTLEGSNALIILNFREEQSIGLGDAVDLRADWRLVLSNYDDAGKVDARLRGYEGRLYVR